MHKIASKDLCWSLTSKIMEPLFKCQLEALIRPVGILFLIKPCEKLLDRRGSFRQNTYMHIFLTKHIEQY